LVGKKINAVKVNKKSVFVKLNEDIYCTHCIENAIMDFKDVCSFTKTKMGLELKPIEDIELDRLGYEFSNYVLGLMKN